MKRPHDILAKKREKAAVSWRTDIIRRVEELERIVNVLRYKDDCE